MDIQDLDLTIPVLTISNILYSWIWVWIWSWGWSGSWPWSDARSRPWGGSGSWPSSEARSRIWSRSGGRPWSEPRSRPGVWPWSGPGMGTRTLDTVVGPGRIMFASTASINCLESITLKAIETIFTVIITITVAFTPAERKCRSRMPIFSHKLDVWLLRMGQNTVVGSTGIMLSTLASRYISVGPTLKTFQTRLTLKKGDNSQILHGKG